VSENNIARQVLKRINLESAIGSPERQLFGLLSSGPTASPIVSYEAPGRIELCPILGQLALSYSLFKESIALESFPSSGAEHSCSNLPLPLRESPGDPASQAGGVGPKTHSLETRSPTNATPATTK
jgi:hypothetical protein